MKECEQIIDLYGELHEGRLEGDTEAAMMQHFGACPHCREDYQWYGVTVRALNGLETPTPPTDFLIQLNSRIDALPSSKFFHILNNVRDFVSSAPHIPLPVGVSALTVLLVLGVFMYSDSARPLIPWPGSSPMPTIADTIGADNLTVESASIDDAVESLKQILPSLEGKLLAQQTGDAARERIVSVMIPSEAYGDLTTRLISHGAVAAGAGPDVQPRKDGRNVLLYIRFVRCR